MGSNPATPTNVSGPSSHLTPASEAEYTRRQSSLDWIDSISAVSCRCNSSTRDLLALPLDPDALVLTPSPYDTPVPNDHEPVPKHTNRQVEENDAFTAASKSQVLAMARVLEVDLLRKLDSVRSGRNKRVHTMTPLSGQRAAEAIGTAVELIRKVANLDLTCEPARGVTVLVADWK